MDEASEPERLSTLELFRRVERLMVAKGLDQAPTTSRREGRLRRRRPSSHTPALSRVEDLRLEYSGILRSPSSSAEEAEAVFRERLIRWLERHDVN